MRATLCLLLLLATVGFAGDDAPRKPVNKEATIVQAELKWAKGVATDFFEAFFRDGYESINCFLDPSFAEAFNSYLYAKSGLWTYSSFSFKGESLSPNNCEAILIGLLKGAKGDGRFYARVAKESNGRWSIRYLRIHHGEKAAEQ